MSRIIRETITILKKHKKIFLLALPIPLIVIYFLVINKDPLYLIQPDQKTIHSKTTLLSYSDKIDNKGNSEVTLLSNTSNKVNFKYTLKDGAFPVYAKIRFTQSDNTFFDLSSYNYVKIKIKATKGSRIQFYLASYISHYTKPDQEITYRYLLNNLNVTNQFANITVPFKHLYTPDWWYIFNNKTEGDFGVPDLSTIQYIYFANCINIKKNEEDIVEIEELSFHVYFVPFIIYSAIFLFFYYGIIAFIFVRKKAKPIPEINFQYEKIKSRNYQDKEEETIFGYLSTHYSQQELTVMDVQNATGIHERKISALIKKKTGLNFKQYLNQLRVTEAKKLLSETNLQISEIAFNVGYGNSSHFNRVFKAFENCSPNDYRKEHNNISTKMK